MRSFFGWAIGLVSLVFVAAAVGDLVKGSAKTPPGVLVGLLLFFLGTAYAGYRLARGSSKDKAEVAAERAAFEEQALLKAAEKNGGRLTLAEAIALSGLSLARCKAVLERFSASGVAELDFDPESNVVYRFPGLGPAEPPPLPPPRPS